LYDQPAESVTDPAEFREPHPVLSGARGGHTIALQQLARAGVRLLGRLAGAEHTNLTVAADLPRNMAYADQRAAGFRRAVDAYLTRAGILAPPPDENPAERPLTACPEPPEKLDVRAEGITSVIWCTGFGPDRSWVDVPVLGAGGAPAHFRGGTAMSTAGAAMTTTGPPRLDRLIRARAIHAMTGPVYRSIGLGADRIAAVGEDAHDLDDLAGPDTTIIDAGDLTLLPAFSDSHEHLLEASRNTLLVRVDRARSIAEFTAIVHAAARDLPPGAWIVTSMDWHESDLAENRLPTGAELDAAAAGHPVLARRGGHLAVATAAALAAADVYHGSPDPPGGKFGRTPDGHLDGLLEGRAVYQIAGFAPAPGRADLTTALGRGSAAYAALGVGTIREAMLRAEDLPAYRDAAGQGLLSVRLRPPIRIGNELSEDAALTLIRRLDAQNGSGDDWLRLWGLKFVMDGGVEAAALEQPYARDPHSTVRLDWDPAVLTRVCAEAVRHGWRIGTHAAGDRAVRAVLDVYSRRSGPGPAAMDAGDRARAAVRRHPAQTSGARRFGVTVQYPLLWNMASEMLTAWGPERTSQVCPLDEWLAAGADLAAGTDSARPVNPMLAVWGMVTRGTRSAGIHGASHAIDVATALQLYTIGSARLNHEADRLGNIAPGKLADLVAYPADLLTADIDELPGLNPVFTVVGGRPVHDLHAILGKEQP
jgi:predicted amidohydrolase YtcJ